MLQLTLNNYKKIWNTIIFSFIIILSNIYPSNSLYSQATPKTQFEEVADSLLHLAKALINNGEAEKGFALTQEEEDKIVANLGNESWLLIRAYANYGNYFDAKFQFEKAIENREKAIALIEKIYHGDHPIYNRVLCTIGLDYNLMGQINKAEEIMLKAKKNIINSANQNQADLIYVEKNLGFVYINSSSLKNHLTN